MLKARELIEELGKEYELMIKQINVADFTKCISQYSGIAIKDLKDEVVKDYLLNWARHKKYIFDFFGGRTQIDLPIEYLEEDRDRYKNKLLDISKKYVAYYPWIRIFLNTPSNKVDDNYISWDNRSLLYDAFQQENFNGTTITHFFKNKLNAPDDMITALGRVWENNNMKATFTLSIDPVDIMLSSENPYNWKSCYRLDNDANEGSHADGCLAGVLDHSTIITYIWKEHGSFKLHGTYDLKDIRYKMMRMTIAVNDNFTAVHFNEIYPGKSNLSDNFHKLLRNKVETYIANVKNVENLWRNNNLDFDNIMPYRQHDEYGYPEYSSKKVWLLKNDDITEYPAFRIYDTTIYCPCGCGEEYMGTYTDAYDYDERYEYNGMGHINENYNIADESWEEYRCYDHDCDFIDCWCSESDAVRYAEDHSDEVAYVEYCWGSDEYDEGESQLIWGKYPED